MKLDLRTPENSWRNQLRKLGYHYDSEESSESEETWKKSIDTMDEPKTISTCTVETCTSIISPNGPTFTFLNNTTGWRVTADLNTIMKVDGIRL